MEKSYKDLLKELEPYNAKLVAVSKTKSPEEIMRLYELGHRDFGENRAREMMEKHKKLPGDIRWHMIGPLQSNKVKYIAPFVHMVHSVDRKKILRYLNKEGKKAGRVIPVLLQVKIASEESKFGYSPAETEQLFTSGAHQKFDHLRICGLMGMATLTDDSTTVRSEFHSLRELFQQIRSRYQPGVAFTELSMGMTGDYRIALEEGATIVRIGSLIFGPRDSNE